MPESCLRGLRCSVARELQLLWGREVEPTGATMFGGQLASSEESPDATVTALRKMPSNKRCANCRSE